MSRDNKMCQVLLYYAKRRTKWSQTRSHPPFPSGLHWPGICSELVQPHSGWHIIWRPVTHTFPLLLLYFLLPSSYVNPSKNKRRAGTDDEEKEKLMSHLLLEGWSTYHSPPSPPSTCPFAAIVYYICIKTWWHLTVWQYVSEWFPPKYESFEVFGKPL